MNHLFFFFSWKCRPTYRRIIYFELLGKHLLKWSGYVKKLDNSSYIRINCLFNDENYWLNLQGDNLNRSGKVAFILIISHSFNAFCCNSCNSENQKIGRRLSWISCSLFFKTFLFHRYKLQKMKKLLRIFCFHYRSFKFFYRNMHILITRYRI